jgi:electron transfer flavoprotein alpha/beta subunit
MSRVAVIIGSAQSESGSGASALPMSDRGALALALANFGADVRTYAPDTLARCHARAAGVDAATEIAELEFDSVDVVLIGRGGCGARGDALPAALAEESGAALVYDVVDVQREAGHLVVTRDLGRGARDVLGVRGRAILVVADSVARGPYVSRHRIEAERAASGDPPTREATGGAEWEPATPRVRLGDHASRVAGPAVERMNALFGVGEVAESATSLVRGSAEECARHLLRYLSHHAFVERESDGEERGVPARPLISQPDERKSQSAVVGTASIPMRVQRRPRPLNDRPLAIRGPFEIGVDL